MIAAFFHKIVEHYKHCTAKTKMWIFKSVMGFCVGEPVTQAYIFANFYAVSYWQTFLPKFFALIFLSLCLLCQFLPPLQNIVDQKSIVLGICKKCLYFVIFNPKFYLLFRLQEATILGDLTEVPVPTRFLFFLLGPAVSLQNLIHKRQLKIYAT